MFLFYDVITLSKWSPNFLTWIYGSYLVIDFIYKSLPAIDAYEKVRDRFVRINTL